MKIAPSPATSALLVIDVQNDFMEGGVLAVPEASRVLPAVNERICSGDYGLVIATQELHPENHGVFAQARAHCVQFTEGAQLHPGLARDRIHLIWRKGMDPKVASPGAFFDQDGRSSQLAELLRARGIRNVDVVGLALDAAVGQTALQAAPAFRTRVLLAGCRAAGRKPGDLASMLARLRQAGVQLVEA